MRTHVTIYIVYVNVVLKTPIYITWNIIKLFFYQAAFHRLSCTPLIIFSGHIVIVGSQANCKKTTTHIYISIYQHVSTHFFLTIFLCFFFFLRFVLVTTTATLIFFSFTLFTLFTLSNLAKSGLNKKALCDIPSSHSIASGGGGGGGGGGTSKIFSMGIC